MAPVYRNRRELETPKWHGCHFCEWRLYVTEVDRAGDTIDIYNLHLRRHAEAMAAAFELTDQSLED